MSADWGSRICSKRAPGVTPGALLLCLFIGKDPLPQPIQQEKENKNHQQRAIIDPFAEGFSHRLEVPYRPKNSVIGADDPAGGGFQPRK